MKKMLSLDSDIVELIYSAAEDEMDNMEDLSNYVKPLFADIVEQIANDYYHLGLHLVGYWNVDNEVDYDSNELKNFFAFKFRKYYPYLLVLYKEFIRITGEEVNTSQYSDTITNNETENKSKTRNKSDNFSNNTHGTHRSAHEESPISDVTINSAPTESTQWNLSNPSAKDGEQFDHHNASANQTAETHSEANTIGQMGTRSGSRSITNENPEQMLKILKFNIENLNISRIAYLYVNSLIEERATIY